MTDLQNFNWYVTQKTVRPPKILGPKIFDRFHFFQFKGSPLWIYKNWKCQGQAIFKDILKPKLFLSIVDQSTKVVTWALWSDNFYQIGPTLVCRKVLLIKKPELWVGCHLKSALSYVQRCLKVYMYLILFRLLFT